MENHQLKLRLGKKVEFEHSGTFKKLVTFADGTTDYQATQTVITAKGIICSRIKDSRVMLAMTDCKDPETGIWYKVKRGKKFNIFIDDLKLKLYGGRK